AGGGVGCDPMQSFAPNSSLKSRLFGQPSANIHGNITARSLIRTYRSANIAKAPFCGRRESPAMLRVHSILYPTDFSSYSNQAYLHAVALAEAHRASLTIVYVNMPGQAADAGYWRDLLEQIRPANPNIPVRHVFLEGDPATEIVRYARDAGVDR